MTKLFTILLVVGILGMLASITLIGVNEMIRADLAIEGRALIVSGMVTMWSLILGVMWEINKA